jgi:hypothetical protein
MAAHCEDCTACCTVFEVKEIEKPFGHTCKHVGKTLFGAGCGIYAERPDACSRYVCLWLDSQRRALEVERMPANLRPDACKVVMGWPWGVERETMHVYPLPGHDDAWRKEPVASHLRMILSRGGKLMIVTGKTRTAIVGDMAVVGTEEEFAQLMS